MPSLRYTGNLILLTIASLLGLLVWWSQPEPLPPLTSINPHQITQIEISDLQGRDIALRRIQDQWLIGTQPANQLRVKQLLGISQTPSLRRFAASDDLHPYGLAPPSIELKLNGEELAIGNNDPVNGWRYILYRDRIHLIADGFHHHLSAPPEAWLEIP
ncbi:MAG: DUF4340 domain-containing protein [Candidatus Thiodiazotropha sp. (ex Ustalcina ferruginea)]|nr:DUF4340 domain-containing protein [Candidatus Thiodiazotropha sp. (ex Ustalcina ferruginea)]